jgi:hypothetical protein
MRIPIQLSDSFTEFPMSADSSWWETVVAEFHNGAYFRPLRRGLTRAVYDASHGEFYLAFRGFQVVQVVLLLVMIARTFRVRTLAGAAVVPLGLAMVVGMHTFAGAVVEGLPINHFLTVLLCCVAAMNLAQAEPGLRVDVAAVAVSLFAMLTIESGLLVAVVLVAALAVGYRGVSRRAVGLVVGCVALYFVVRFVVIHGAAPGLGERSTGFGFKVLEPQEVVARFGANPLPLYAYNVLSAMACVLLGEPRGGVWTFLRGVAEGPLQPWQVVNVVTCVLTTWLMLLYVVRSLPRWRQRQFTPPDRFVLIFLALLPSNALFAAVYAKDVIMSVAGMFYGIAAYFVIREQVDSVSRPSAEGRSLAIAPWVMMVVVLGWSVKLVGIHQHLSGRAFAVRDEWAYYDDWERDQPQRIELGPEGEIIRKRLYEGAVLHPPHAVRMSFGALEQLFDPTQ